jgi:vacuolar-type H+-ATPase subunit H
VEIVVNEKMTAAVADATQFSLNAMQDGYNCHQVDAFCDRVTDTLRQWEGASLQETSRVLLMAQQTADAVLAAARSEAENTIAEARVQARTLLREAEQHVAGLAAQADDYRVATFEYRKRLQRLAEAALESLNVVPTDVVTPSVVSSPAKFADSSTGANVPAAKPSVSVREEPVNDRWGAAQDVTLPKHSVDVPAEVAPARATSDFMVSAPMDEPGPVGVEQMIPDGIPSHPPVIDQAPVSDMDQVAGSSEVPMPGWNWPAQQ